MNASPIPAKFTAPPTRPRRRWRRIALIVLSVLIAGATLLLVYSHFATQHAWEAAEAEANEDLPRWRLHELEEDRRSLADQENAALVIIAVQRKGRGVNLGGTANYDKVFEKLTPNTQLNGQQINLLRRELGKIAGPLKDARKLKDMPHGRFPIKFSDDWIGTLIPDHQSARQMGQWLSHDAMLLAQQEEYDRAVQSCRATINAGRSMADDPFLISVLIRYALRTDAVNALERVLAQGEASDESLEAMQKALAQEMNENALLVGLRGERAGMHLLFDNIRQGKVQSNWLASMGIRAGGGGFADPASEWLIDIFPSVLLKYYPDYLHHMNRTVEAAKLPPPQQSAKFRELDDELKQSKNPVVRLLMPAISKVQRADSRSQAYLRSAVVALACERYRLKSANKQWPASLDDLVKEKWIERVPTDPLDGQPLRYRRTKDGIVIYSIGSDLKDDKGNIDRAHPDQPGVDLGFRLWDLSARRRPPLPPIELPDGEPRE